MPELTFMLAILVNKDILSVQEARKLKIALSEHITSSNLGEMITKVSKALEDKESEVEKIDAEQFFKTS